MPYLFRWDSSNDSGLLWRLTGCRAELNVGVTCVIECVYILIIIVSLRYALFLYAIHILQRLILVTIFHPSHHPKNQNFAVTALWHTFYELTLNLEHCVADCIFCLSPLPAQKCDEHELWQPCLSQNDRGPILLGEEPVPATENIPCHSWRGGESTCYGQLHSQIIAH